MMERTLLALTMDENVFVLLEDPMSMSRLDIEAAMAENHPVNQNPPHYRTTFLTVSPPGALEQLVTHLKARWVPVRGAGQGGGQQLTIDGIVFRLGTDWLVRIGNVVQASGAVKGMLVEVRDVPILCYYKPQCEHHLNRPSIFRYHLCNHPMPMARQNCSPTCYCRYCRTFPMHAL
jgi:hypothetical protein